MELDRIWVYHLQVAEARPSAPRPVEGGELGITDDIRSIFEPAFLGREKRSPARQPFHFNLGGKIRSNVMRDRLLTLMDPTNSQPETVCAELATDLQTLIDDRVGDLLFTVALGRETDTQRCAMWVYPSDSPLRFFSKQGKPMVEELRRAFSRRSRYRKAAFFQGPVKPGRSDFVKGEIVDLTRQGKSRSVAHYWVERFLHGQIELRPARGVYHLAKGLKLAQQAAKTPEETSSVAAAYNHLLSGAQSTTALSQFANMLVGQARDAYLSAIPTTIERDAVFDVDLAEVRRRVTRIALVLSNRIVVLFPADGSVDPDEYLSHEDGQTILRLELPVQERYFESR